MLINTDMITQTRLINQRISAVKRSMNPEDTVFTMGAIQAQDYQAALWAIGLRCKEGTTKSDVESAIASKKIIRTWLMRGTIHFASSSDILQMLQLFGPRLIKTGKLRDSHLGLSPEIIKKVESLFSKALEGGNQLKRSEMYKIMEKGGVPHSNNIGYHMLYRAAWDGIICFGLHEGKEATFSLLEDSTPKQYKFDREKALKDLAIRYFNSHGPATLEDYVWWSGLKVSDAKLGMEMVKSRLSAEEAGGKTYYMPRETAKSKETAQSLFLLPAFDEYIISYKDRSQLLDNANTQKLLRSGKVAFIHSNGVFLPTIVIEGKVVGTWRRELRKGKLEIILNQFAKISQEHRKLISDEAERYGRFFEIDAKLKT